jgi:hypothetical protein
LIEAELRRDFFGALPPKQWPFSACEIAAAEQEGRTLAAPVPISTRPARRAAPADQVPVSVAPVKRSVAPATQFSLDNAKQLMLLEDLQDELER